MNALYDFGIALIQALQTLSPALDGVMEFFSFLGRIEFYLLLTPFIYWTFSASLGMRLLLMLVTTGAFSTVLKHLFHQPRPYWLGGVKELAQETSYGVPSSHASNSLSFWVYLGDKVKQRWLWFLVVVLIFFIGYSRMHLAVHFPHDVLVGWIVGAVMFYAFTRVEAGIGEWAQRQSALRLVMVGLGGSLAIIVLGLAVLALISGIPDPEPWRELASEARVPNDYFTLSGALFGAVAGYALMRRTANFRPAPSWTRRGLSYLLGIIVTLLIYYGLDIGFAELAADDTPLGYFLRYVRYGCVTLWVTYLAPWTFIKFGLAVTN